MQAILRLVFIYCALLPTAVHALRRRCINTGVLFTDKIISSPIIVYGEPTAKQIYRETDAELLFNVTFRVDCIFKGQEIEDRIEITGAGIQSGRTACQWLDPGSTYVVFLEKCGAKTNLYCPLDFQERLVDDITHELLQKTCHLTSAPPLHATAANCPNVSMAEFCPNDEVDVKIMPKSRQPDPVNTNMRTSFNNANQFYLQSNVTIPTRSVADQIADKPSSVARLSELPSLSMVLLAVNAVVRLCN